MSDTPCLPDAHSQEVSAGARFAFGRNWSRFLERLDERRIEQATSDLRSFLRVARLDGKSFLDVGSGSGLSSLAAWRLGARVKSFDYDPESVACTNELRRRFAPDGTRWEVERASVLDRDFLKTLGRWDVVYSWGVLHHTGAMWQALDNVAPLVEQDGRLLVAIYNDQGRASRTWLRVKRAYCALPRGLRPLVVAPAMLRLWGPTVLRDALRGSPLRSWKRYGDEGLRGMDAWRDAIDWIGGLPFEVATPEAIFHFYVERGFSMVNLSTCAGGIGCNQFVFRR